MNRLFPVGILMGVLLFTACRQEDDLYTGGDARLEFSADTLKFDTVFTALGSSTRILKVYNPQKKTLRISRIHVAGGESSVFRFNIDGFPSNEVTDVEIAAEDSLYIFGEVTIDPDQPLSISPFVIGDELIFETNNNIQQVVLEAWGQNANYLPNRFGGGSGITLSCDNGEIIWDDPKPYVIYGIVVIDECTLRIPPGAKVYVHGGLGSFLDDNDMRVYFNDGRLVIGPAGRLVIDGTLEKPVIIQGDRLEEDFNDEAGQWWGIVLASGSRNNIINHTTVKNSIVGIAVDSAAQLTVSNSRFFNTTANGLVGIHSTITATNCLFYNNNSGGVRLLYGGDYDFTYCTVASYGVDASALSVSNILCLDPLCTQARSYRLRADFKNCIFHGSRRDEIVLVDAGEDAFDYSFQHCIIRIDELDDADPFTDFFDFCDPCYEVGSEENLFVDANGDDYHLDTLSVAEGKAMPLGNIMLDLEGRERDAANPDLGCYEYHPE